MHLDVFPSVAQVTFIGIEAYQSVTHENAESLGWFVVVFMDLGQSFGEREFFTEEGMRGRQFDKLFFREDLFHLASDIRIHSVIIIDVEKTSCFEV